MLEMTEIADRTLRAGGPALLFENPKGHDVPVLGNLFGTPERLVRVDMSELTGPLAQARLLGSGDQASQGALVHRIRELAEQRQPES